MNFLLTAKHWQVFIFIFGFYCLAILARIFGTILNLFDLIIPLNTVSSIITLVSLAAWQFTIARSLNRKLQPALTINLALFMILISIKFSYNLVLWISAWITRYTEYSISERIWSVTEIIATDIYIWLVFAFGVSAYLAFVLSKLLVLEQENRPVAIRDHFGTFLLFFFYPIGVWFIQPRLNHIFSDQEPEVNFDLPLDHNMDQR